MKVFLSWSGGKSHKIALAFREWFPSVIQNVEPYVSSEDIDKGTRWSTDISKELEGSAYGILCVTRENVDAPWLNFETGALSKSFDKARVTPFLFDVKRSELQGPLLQFQSATYEMEDLRKLVFSINKSCGESAIPETRLQRIFDVWWPQLKAALDSLVSKQNQRENKPRQRQMESADILEELLELVRFQHKLLSSPESLLPRDYLTSLIQATKAATEGIPQIGEAIRNLLVEDKPIQAIKLLREATGFDLKDSKDMIDALRGRYKRK